MSYDYRTEKAALMNEEGFSRIFRTLLHVQKLFEVTSVISMSDAMRGAGSGTNWSQLACVDFLVEIGYLCEIRQAATPAGQDRIFTRRGHQ